MKDKVIGSGKPKGVNKSPWEQKIRKGRGCPRGNGTQEPTSNVTKSLMTILSHGEKNKQQTQRSLAGLGLITSQQEWQNGAAGNAKTVEKSKRMG